MISGDRAGSHEIFEAVVPRLVRVGGQEAGGHCGLPKAEGPIHAGGCIRAGKRPQTQILANNYHIDTGVALGVFTIFFTILCAKYFL